MSKNYLAIDDQDESVVDKKQYSFFNSLSFLYQFTIGQRFSLIVSITFLLILSIFTMLSGYGIGILVGEGLVKKNWDLVIRWSAIVLVLEILTLIFSYFGRKILAESTSVIILNIRKELFQKLNRLSLSFYDRWPQGRVVTRITHDVEGVETFFTGSLGRIFNAFFLALSSIVAMLASDLKLGTILIVSMIPALSLVLLTKGKVNVLNRKMSKYSSEINSKLSEFIDGINVIRSFGLEEWSNGHFSSAIKKHLDITLKANYFYAFVNPTISFLCGMPVIMLIWFGGNNVISGVMSLTIFIAFIRYTERFFSPVMMLFREIHVILQAFTSAQRVANFLREDDEKVLFGDGEFEKEKINGEVEFKNVYMSYDGENDVLKDINFKVSQGEKIGIIGSTGSGKTTIISVLARLYDYHKGQVLVDGEDIKNWSLEALRSQIGLVSQDVVIFKGSLRDNLTVDDSLLDSHILEVAKHTGLIKVMNKNNLSLESEIKDAGANLSAGEKQVISLTRTCLLDPHILILDEATANVDPYYEKILHDGVEYLMQGRTSFVIAHRLDTIKECDRLLVFDAGNLVEDGSPKALYDNKGIYYELVKAKEFISNKT